MLKHIVLLGILVFMGCSEQRESGSNLSAESEELLSRVNELRKKGCRCGTDSMPPVNPIAWNTKLATVAKLHSEDMIARDYFSHTTPDGVSFSQRITNGGYVWSACGENIAAGQTSAESVITAWKNSPGHCKNMMGQNYTEMGVGRSGNHWTQVFAKPR